MAIIPNDQQINTLSGFVNTKQAGSANTDRLGRYYIMQDITDTVRPYKVYTAILDQKGNSSIQVLSEGELDPRRTYEIIYNSPGMDFTNVGAPNNNVGTFFVATGEFPKSWGVDEGQEDILRANAAAPITTVLENTIGDIWFVYNNTGYYSVKSNQLFTQGKTTVSFSPGSFIESPDDIYNTNVSFGNGTDFIDITSYYNYDLQNDVMNYAGDAMIEIRVYN